MESQIQSVGTLGLPPFKSPEREGGKKQQQRWSLLEELDTSAIADGDDLSLVVLL